MTIQELMQKRAGLCDKQKAIVDKAMAEARGMTEAENAEFNTLQAEISSMANTIEAAQAMETREAELNKPTDQILRPAVLAGAPAEDKLDDGGFKNVGELLAAVRFGDKTGRLQALSTGDAGIKIPPAFSQDILSVRDEGEIVMPRATVIPAGDPPDGEFVIPYFQQGADGANGGVQLAWTAEGQTIPDSKEPGIKDLTLKPQEVAGLATINNKTLANWQAAGAFIAQVMRQAFVSGRDYKFLRGAGVGTPLGVLKAPGAIKVARKTAGTITFEDVAKMFGRLLPEAMEGAVWVASITDLPTIVQMADSAGRLIYLPGNATQGIPATLLGVPVLWTGKVPVLGEEGDLALVSFKHYLCKPGSGPFVALSEHVNFKTNQTVFRIVANVDGQPWVKEPLKLEDGKTTVSPYVILK